MASTCLPMLFQAVEIDGEHYWDGGYSANPALLPLINECESVDIVLVQLNPLAHEDTPHTPQLIAQRVNELAFNASLLQQMRSIDALNQLLAEGRLAEVEQYRSPLLHRIDIDGSVEDLPASSKVSTDAALLELLFERGRAAGQRLARTALRRTRKAQQHRHPARLHRGRCGHCAGGGDQEQKGQETRIDSCAEGYQEDSVSHSSALPARRAPGRSARSR